MFFTFSLSNLSRSLQRAFFRVSFFLFTHRHHYGAHANEHKKSLLAEGKGSSLKECFYCVYRISIFILSNEGKELKVHEIYDLVVDTSCVDVRELKKF